ncbi:hypothetical protein HN858_03225 [Candidatus Falkowbacteria bacterium]|jgi:hypothetical protein|nr:hypothetical protein [Candidatus Falkowbacteria bacterium]MBT5503098.1 hypothetical protein [Candidatus Falkowbacteria bacterium]MBT6574192.1 hypothetical protein [Candidatus Falkowbacteria bacterium]MBT7348661.1 hypothetical protein [Candidatus Falkowbacteria bacterium]MBT7500451.1 hypothetical protein [Candidatus Falkowbacteria bacterium]
MSEHNSYVHEIGCPVVCPSCNKKMNIRVRVNRDKILCTGVVCTGCYEDFELLDETQKYILRMSRKAETVRIKPKLGPAVAVSENRASVSRKRSWLISILLHIPFLVTIAAGLWFASSFSGETGQKTFGFREIGLIFIFWLSLKQSLKLVQRDPVQHSPKKTEE